MYALLIALLVSIISTDFSFSSDSLSNEKAYKDYYSGQVSLEYKEDVYRNFLRSVYDARTKQELNDILLNELHHAEELKVDIKSNRSIYIIRDLISKLKTNEKTIKEVKVLLHNEKENIQRLVNQNTYIKEMKNILRAMPQYPEGTKNLIDWMSNQFEVSLEDAKILKKIEENKLKNKDGLPFEKIPNNISSGNEKPTRIEILNHLAKIMELKNLDKSFKLKQLLESDTEKYTVLIEVPQGEQYILEVKRREGDSSNKYDFLKGSSRTTSQPSAIHLRFAHHSKFLNLPEISPRARFYIRSTPNDLPKKDEDKKAAKAILSTVSELLFPTVPSGEENELTEDIISINNKSGSLGFSSIDWRELLLMKESDRDNISKLIAYSEAFTKFGVSDELLENLIQSFSLSKEKKQKLSTVLKNYYPNRSGVPSNSMINYYYLLSTLEDYGLEKKTIHYSLIKILQQFEGHEKLLIGEDHRSPRKELEKRVSLEFDKLKAFVKSSPKENAAQSGIDNSNLKILLTLMNIDKNTKDKILSNFLTLPEKFLDLVKELKKYSNKKNKIDIILTNHPQTQKNIDWGLSTQEGLILLLTSPQETHAEIEKSHHDIANQIKGDHEVTANSVGSLYGLGAEGSNALFWSLWDQDKEKAMTFVKKLATTEKQAGFGAFAVTIQIFSRLTDPKIPHSMAKTRFVARHGVGMGVSMIASELAHRSLSGRGFSKVADSMMTKNFLKEVSYGRFRFMTAIAALDKASESWLKSQKRIVKPCPTAMRKLGRLALVFMGAEAVNRGTRSLFENLNILDTLDTEINKNITGLSQNYLSQIEPIVELIEDDSQPKWKKFSALFDKNYIKKNLLCNTEGKQYFINNNLLSDDIMNKCSIPLQQNFTLSTSKVQLLIDEYLLKINELETDKDNEEIQLIIANIKRRCKEISNTVRTTIHQELTPAKRDIFLELSIQEQIK